MGNEHFCACSQVPAPCTERMTQEDLLCDRCRASECVKARDTYMRQVKESYSRPRTLLPLPPRTSP